MLICVFKFYLRLIRCCLPLLRFSEHLWLVIILMYCIFNLTNIVIVSKWTVFVFKLLAAVLIAFLIDTQHFVRAVSHLYLYLFILLCDRLLYFRYCWHSAAIFPLCFIFLCCLYSLILAEIDVQYWVSGKILTMSFLRQHCIEECCAKSEGFAFLLRQLLLLCYFIYQETQLWLAELRN